MSRTPLHDRMDTRETSRRAAGETRFAVAELSAALRVGCKALYTGEMFAHILMSGTEQRKTRKEIGAMIAVIAENILKDGQEQAFLDLSTRILPSIEAIDGFLSVERFESLAQPGKILSLSFWRDEQALLALRQNEPHRGAEEKGRADILKDYHIRIAQVFRDYGMFDREQAPVESEPFHSPQ